MKKILIALGISVVLVVLFFFVPVREIRTGCAIFGIPEKTEKLTTYQAFKQGYLQIPKPDNSWTIITEPASACV